MPLSVVKMALSIVVLFFGLMVVDEIPFHWGAVAVFWFFTGMWIWSVFIGSGAWRKRRRFEIRPDALVLMNGERIARRDVAKLYTESPVFRGGSTGFANGSFISVVHHPDTVVSRATSIQIEALGKRHVLASGLSEIKADAVVHEINKVWR